MSKYKIIIILVNYNTPKYLLKSCLNSLNNKKILKYNKIVFVDNSSKDQLYLKKLKIDFPFIDFIFNDKNSGFGGGNNIGIRYSLKKYNPEFFYFLNTDTRVRPNFLSESIKCINQESSIAIVGSNQKNFSNKFSPSSADIVFKGVNYNTNFKKNKFVNWVSGAGFLIRTKILKEINFFDEVYNPAYYEETDLEKKCLRKGYKILFCSKSLIWHKGGGSIDFGSDYLFYIFHRNRIIYFLRHYSIWFFSLRFFYDIYKALKQKKLRLLLKAYKEGYRKKKKITQIQNNDK